MRFEYPSLAEVIEANKRVLKELPVKRKDSHEVLSFTKIDTVLESCAKIDSDVYDHAACLMAGLTRAHAFASGNRRTAYLIAKSFIERNHAELRATNGEEAIAILKKVRAGSLSDKELKMWLKGEER